MKKDFVIPMVLTLIGVGVAGYIAFDTNAERIGRFLGKMIGKKAQEKIKALAKGEPEPPPTTPMQRMIASAGKEAVVEIRQGLTWQDIFG